MIGTTSNELFLGRKNKKIKRMEKDKEREEELNIFSCLDALDMTSDQFLICSFSLSLSSSPLLHEINPTHPFYTQLLNNTSKIKILTLNNYLFMNKAAKSTLGYTKEREDKEESIKGGGEVVIVDYGNSDKLHCSVKLYNSNNEIHRMFGICTIRENENICILKLQEYELEEHLYLSKYFSSLGVFMTIVELGPDDGTYEWRHCFPNKMCFGTYKLPYDKVSSYCASDRNSLRERKHFHNACMASKLHGIQVPIIPDITDTYTPLLGSHIAYIGSHPITNRDLFACAVFDPKTVKMATERVAELGDFFEFAPMMMGAAKITKGKLSSLYCNQAAADFCQLTKREMMGDIDKIAFYAGELENVFTGHFKQSREKRERPITFDVKVPAPTGKEHFFTSTVSTISFNKEIDESKHVFIMLDLTAQKEAELALEAHKNSLEETVKMRTLELKEKEQRFRSLVSNAPNIILSVDRHGVVEYPK